MKKFTILLLILAGVLTACASIPGLSAPVRPSTMMQRHMARIPDSYSGMQNSVTPDEASLARGAETFNYYCVPCHGESGMGDGEFADQYSPQPAPIAHTSLMMGDDYLFWRVSEGGVPFNTAMVIFKERLTPEDRWDVINYVRSIGGGEMMGGGMMGEGGMMGGGNQNRGTGEEEEHAEMLAAAMDRDLITQEEADIFEVVHATLTDHILNSGERGMGKPDEFQQAMLAEMVEQGKVTQTQADTFSRVHDILGQEGLMD